MYKATLICDADVGVLASREDKHPADDLALRAWQKWREKGSSSTTCENVDMDLVDDYIRKQTVAPFFLDFTDFIYEHNILFGVVTQRMATAVMVGDFVPEPRVKTSFRDITIPEGIDSILVKVTVRQPNGVAPENVREFQIPMSRYEGTVEKFGIRPKN